ncbi:phytanoyl-CoA dioxygenase family protein [Larkinella soli]|uniref:phytanoyl-CoA dioxygenase family protein n=1 Tax=Larkinella soli TaxID=1770527 RepID=UPI000FFB5BE9|nr:phytanoyl-CoA dioxygenase family protein [Larkinella soli]
MKTDTVAHSMTLPWIESPFFYEVLTEKAPTEALKQQAIRYHEDGFLILKGAVSHDLIDRAVAQIGHEYPDRMNVPPIRHQDLWKKYDTVREIAVLEPVQTILAFLYGRDPIPFQTLNFKYGTQQRGHSDTIHFSSVPARYMCGVWVAFEPTHPGNGPLFYYPKSHKLAEYNYFDLGIQGKSVEEEYDRYEDYIEEFMAAKGFSKQEIYLEKGDVMIWSSNLIHGGMPIRVENSTRWSQVTHYYFRDCLYYSPRFSDMLTNNLNLRNVIHIGTGEKVRHTFNGRPIETINTGEFRYAISQNFSLWTLMKGMVRKMIGFKPF